jgi:hypothetical protein
MADLNRGCSLIKDVTVPCCLGIKSVSAVSEVIRVVPILQAVVEFCWYDSISDWTRAGLLKQFCLKESSNRSFLIT